MTSEHIFEEDGVGSRTVKDVVAKRKIPRLLSGMETLRSSHFAETPATGIQTPVTSGSVLPDAHTLHRRRDIDGIRVNDAPRHQDYRAP